MICEIFPKIKISQNALTTSNLEHSRFTDCTQQLHLGAVCVEIYFKWLRAIKMEKEQIQ